MSRARTARRRRAKRVCYGGSRMRVSMRRQRVCWRRRCAGEVQEGDANAGAVSAVRCSMYAVTIAAQQQSTTTKNGALTREGTNANARPGSGKAGRYCPAKKERYMYG